MNVDELSRRLEMCEVMASVCFKIKSSSSSSSDNMMIRVRNTSERRSSRDNDVTYVYDGPRRFDMCVDELRGMIESYEVMSGLSASIKSVPLSLRVCLKTTTESGEFAMVNEPDSIYTGKPFLKTVVTNIFQQQGWKTTDTLSEKRNVRVQWDVYENLDWKRAFSSNLLVNGYCNRNGLIRKAHLCATLNKAKRKLPGLNKCVPVTIPVCIDPRPDWFGLSIADITEEVDKDESSLWILKPSRFDRGDDKHVVRTAKECEKALWDGRNLVEWVCQQYIDRPLLVHGRKFHIRANVLAAGALEVFLHTKSIIVTTAALPYKREDLSNPHIHLSNAIFARTYHTKQTNKFEEENFKFLLPRLCEILPSLQLEDTISNMARILRDVFKAFETELNGFMPHPNCFELFGVDFMIDEDGEMYIFFSLCVMIRMSYDFFLIFTHTHTTGTFLKSMQDVITKVCSENDTNLN